MEKILLIEDDVSLKESLTVYLEKENFEVYTECLKEKVLTIIKNKKIDLVILDINLPDINGFDLFSLIKEVNRKIPVIFLSACDLDDDILKGFDLGGEDYITKPFNVDILIRKINVVLRRNVTKSIYSNGYLKFNFKTLELSIKDRLIALTPTEKRLLEYLLRNKERVLTKENILAYLWDNNNNYVDEHTLLVNVSRLRKKIEDKNHKYIQTVYGIGYRWNDDK